MTWPAGIEQEFNVEAAPKNIKSFSLKINKGKDLKQGSKGVNPFCEVYWGTQLIGKTAVIKGAPDPNFMETFTVQYKNKPTNFSVEVYDMEFMGKGAFLGRTEIKFDQLLVPTIAEIDLALKHKLGVNAKKQKYVGGILSLEYSMEVAEVAEDDDEEHEHEAIVSIPWTIWKMEAPTLMLNVVSGSDLPKANLFGGSSDPFVVIYWSNSEEPLFKTRYIENNIDPVRDPLMNIIH